MYCFFLLLLFLLYSCCYVENVHMVFVDLCVLQSKVPVGIKSGNYNKVRSADKFQINLGSSAVY